MAALKLQRGERRIEWQRPGRDEAAVFYVVSPSDVDEAGAYVAHLEGPGPITRERELDYRTTLAIASVIRWEGVVDEAGEPVPCDADSKAALFRRHRLAALAVYRVLYPETAANRPPLPVAGSSSEAPAPGNGSPAEATSPEMSAAAST